MRKLDWKLLTSLVAAFLLASAAGSFADVLDSDGDGIPNVDDVCPFDPLHDSVGDPCDHDEDDDGFSDFIDECPLVPDFETGCPPSGPTTGCGIR